MIVNTLHIILIILSYNHCTDDFVTMLCILHIDQDEIKLELVNIAQQEKQINIEKNKITLKLL